MTFRLLRAELMRLRSDYVLLGFLAIVLVVSLAVALSNSNSLTTSSASLEAGLSQVVTVATLYGTIRYVFDNHKGLVARTVLSGHRNPTLIAKTATTALCGVLIGAVGGVVSLVTLGVALSDSGVLPALLYALPAAAASAVFGLYIGMAVRNYFLAPVVIFSVHIVSALLVESWPDVGRMLPLGATMSIVYSSRPDLLPLSLGVVMQLTWLLVLGTLAWMVMNLRDVT